MISDRMFNHITSLFTDETKLQVTTKLLPKLQHFYTTMPMFNVTTQKWTYDSAAEAELNKDWTYDPPGGARQEGRWRHLLNLVLSKSYTHTYIATALRGARRK